MARKAGKARSMRAAKQNYTKRHPDGTHKQRQKKGAAYVKKAQRLNYGYEG